MRFRIIVMSRRIIREEWVVEADNATEAETLHHDGCSDFQEEVTESEGETWVDQVINLTDPDGLLEVDEGL